MRITSVSAFAAAAALAAVAAPLPAAAAEATGDLIVTRFDDRFADGLYDPSLTAPSGDADRLNTALPAQLVDVNGERWYVSADEDGLYRFDDVPVGPAKLYLMYPNNPPGEVLFDATGAESAADITRLDTAEYFGVQGVLDVVIDEDGEERLIGMSALRLAANVELADGTPVSGASVELGSGGDWYPATEYGFAGGEGTYEAFRSEGGYVRHLPGQLGVRIDAPEGYEVAEVTAADNNEFAVTEADGAWWFSSTEVWNYFWNPAFTITLEEAAPADTTAPTATVKQGAEFTTGDASGYGRVSFKLHDEGKIDRVEINGVEKDLVDNAWSDVNFVAPGVFGATAGRNTMTVYDVAGNATTVSFTLDATAPTATLKSGETYTVGNESGYDKVSFKLHDGGKVDRVEINGVVKDLTNNAWSDVNFIRPGVFGGRSGENTMIVYDIAGNSREVTFILN
ncbi:hypothetical protein GCM10027064_15480 [Microbacterium petrolearium]